MSDVLVKVEGVSKKFCKTLKRSMMYGMQDITGNMLGMATETDRLRPGEFWSVDDVSFEVRRGECLGLIGPNGAGKSTLLKILNGIISPDIGCIRIKGKVGALIEVGAGFHPMLTGRENIYVNGAILGFSRKEIEERFNDIVAFSELDEFIDTPVKHYSSGMYVRLGFAIAIQMEPDVLLIDEVLAVGDVGFRAKCFNALAKIAKNTAIILVSHAMPQVARVCSEICVMSHGKVIYFGKNVPMGMEHYYNQFQGTKGVIAGGDRARINEIRLESKGIDNVVGINYLDDLSVHIYLDVVPEIKHPVVAVSFLSRELQSIAQCCSIYNGVRLYNSGEQMHVIIKFREIYFNPGNYLLSVHITDERRIEVLTEHYAVKEIKVIGEFIGQAPIQLKGEWYSK